ncbi:Chaperone protein DnaJ [Bienertia sinuspersici]
MGQNRRRSLTRVKAVDDDSMSTVDAFADDYYAVLGLTPDATPQQIRKAYYSCMKACHPDLTGDDQEANNFCKFINEVYGVLSDPVQRMVYDEIHGYSLTATNPFMDDSSTRDHDVKTARMWHQRFSKLRKTMEGLGSTSNAACLTSPVDCIHWTSAAQLSLLEDEMRRVERVNVALMLAGMGASSDVFRMEKARLRMMQQDGTGGAESYWDNLRGNQKDYQSTEEEVKERARRAAAAARRWREYSRKGADKAPAYKLPEAVEVSKE